MSLLLASAPILTAVGLILLLRQSALRAGLAGLAVAMLVVLLVPSFALEGPSLIRSLARGLMFTASVAYILLGGVLLYQVLRVGGALDVLSRSVAHAIPDEGHRLLSLVFGLSVFFESATGFGVGIVVTAPLLMALGYDPIRAGLLALLGQCAVPWGALAIGTVLGAELTAVPAGDLGLWASLLGFPYVVASGALALKIAGAWSPVGPRGLLLLLYSLLLSLALAVGSVTVGVELAGCLAGLAILVVGLLAGGRGRATDAAGREPNLLGALMPLGFLLGSLLITRLVPGLPDLLEPVLLIDLPGARLQAGADLPPRLLAGGGGGRGRPVLEDRSGRARRNPACRLASVGHRRPVCRRVPLPEPGDGRSRHDLESGRRLGGEHWGCLSGLRSTDRRPRRISHREQRRLQRALHAVPGLGRDPRRPADRSDRRRAECLRLEHHLHLAGTARVGRHRDRAAGQRAGSVAPPAAAGSFSLFTVAVIVSAIVALWPLL